jgi:hypothetical protein
MPAALSLRQKTVREAELCSESQPEEPNGMWKICRLQEPLLPMIDTNEMVLTRVLAHFVSYIGDLFPNGPGANDRLIGQRQQHKASQIRKRRVHQHYQSSSQIVGPNNCHQLVAISKLLSQQECNRT